MRRKVFEIAGNDDLRSADECGGDNVFVILVRKSESAVEKFPVVNARVLERCRHSVNKTPRLSRGFVWVAAAVDEFSSLVELQFFEDGR